MLSKNKLRTRTRIPAHRYALRRERRKTYRQPHRDRDRQSDKRRGRRKLRYCQSISLKNLAKHRPQPDPTPPVTTKECKRAESRSCRGVMWGSE